MANTFAFIGHELMRSHVSAKLSDIGWTQVSEIADADVAFTYCISTHLLEDAYFDEEGLVKNALPGTCLVDLSPSTPSFSREVSAVALVNDLSFVEAPLAVADPLGGLSFTCFVASEEPEGIERVRPLLEAIASEIEETGAVGTAQLAKASMTARTTARTVGIIESEALVRAAREVAHLEAQALDSEDHYEGYPIELMLADVVAAMTAADDVDLILPQLEAVMHLLELMAVIGGADMSPRALSLLYREEAASAEAGLDWTRAESLYAEYGPGHDHDHDHGHVHDDGYDEFGFDDDLGFPGGFGGYSSN